MKKESVRPIRLIGLHAYAQKWIPAGSNVELKVSSDVPYKLSWVRLGWDVDTPSLDEVIDNYDNKFFPAIEQVIRPGSFLEISPGLSHTQDFGIITFETWIRVFNNSQSIWRGIITQHSYPTACGIGLFLSPDDRLNFYGGSGIDYEPTRSVTSDIQIPRNKWCHVAGVFDGTRHTITFYLTPEGGVTEVDEKYIPDIATIHPGPVQMRIGAYGSEGHTNQFLDGDLAMPSVHLCALTSEEIRTRVLSATLPAFDDSVWGCWPLTEGGGDLAHDASGHAHHAIVVNGPAWRVSPPLDPASIENDFDLVQPGRPTALRLTSDDLADCAWETTHTILVNQDSKAGIYVVRIGYGKDEIYDVTVVVAPSPLGTPAQTAIITNTSTWLAYNSQPFTVTNNTKNGQVLYGIDGPIDADTRVRQGPFYSCYAHHSGGQPGMLFSSRVPWPAARPYIYYYKIHTVEGSQTTGMEGRPYSHLLRAERFTHVWLEQQNCKFDTLPDLLIDLTPSILSSYKSVIICGHAEYWSDRMLDAVKNYLDNGGNLVVLSGNTLNWRVTHNHLAGIMECRKFAPLGDYAAAYVPHAESVHQLDGKLGGLPRAHGRAVRDVLGLECGSVLDVETLRSFKLIDNRHLLLNEPIKIDTSNPLRFGIGGVNHETDTLYGPLPGGMTVLASCSVAGKNLLNYDESAFVEPANGLVYLDAIALITFWERPLGGNVFYVGSVIAGMALFIMDQTNSGQQPRLAQLVKNALAHFGSLP